MSLPTENEVAELLTALIRNECVNDGTPDSGREVRSVNTLADYLGRPGQMYEPHPGRQSVVYRVPGTTPGAPRLALMGHLDVVPANPAGWSRDPFEAEVVDGVLWGRGAVDMLNLTASMAAVFRRYLRGQVEPPPGDLLFLGVADEEAGGALGARYLVEEHWDRVACEFLLTEIGYPALATSHGPVYPVSVGEKGPYWRRLRTTGTPSHGSQPYRADNAMVVLARAVTALAEQPTPVEFCAEWHSFVAGLGLPAAEAAALLDPGEIDTAIDRMAARSPAMARYVHACTHLTVSPNVLWGGIKANVIADEAVAEVDVRAVPGQDAATVERHLRQVLGAEWDRIEVEPVLDHPPTTSPPRGALWDAIGDAFAEVAGSAQVLPTLMPVATDARFFRARGTTAYGVGLYDEGVDFADFMAMFHGNDERVSVASLGATARLLARVVEALGDRSG